MKIFISWSGDKSKAVALALHKYLPVILHSVRTFMSSQSIDPGTRGIPRISEELDQTNVGIACLTTKNMKSPWIMYEAGALSKSLDKNYLFTYLIDLKVSEVISPLSQFQHTAIDRTETRRMVAMINSLLGDNRLDDARFEMSFSKFYPDLAKELTAAKEIDEAGEVVTPKEGDRWIDIQKSLHNLTNTVSGLAQKVEEMSRAREVSTDNPFRRITIDPSYLGSYGSSPGYIGGALDDLPGPTSGYYDGELNIHPTTMNIEPTTINVAPEILKGLKPAPKSKKK